MMCENWGRTTGYSQSEVKREGFYDFDYLRPDDSRASFYSSKRFCREESLLDGEAGQFPGPHKDAREHGAVESARIRVSQGWVIGRKQMQAVREKILGSV
jgi:hypothetical protein